MARKKTHEEYKQDLAEKYPEFECLGEYQGNKVKILHRHKICGYEWEVKPNVLLTNTHGCPFCSGKVRKDITYFRNEVKKLDNDYDVVGEYVNTHTKTIFIHKTCGNKFKMSPRSFLSGQRCPKCQHRSYVKTTEEFKKELYEFVGDEYELIDEYVNNRTKIKYIHRTCGKVWKQTPSEVLNGYRCNHCFGNKKLTQKEFENRVFEQRGNEYTVIGKYVNFNSKVKMKHNKCGMVWDIKPNYFLGKESGCPKCNQSKGEFRIEKYLIENNIAFVPQKTYPDLVGIRNLPLSYDFYLPKFNLLIEFQGQQHEYAVDWFGGKEKFERQKKIDRLKKDYAKLHNIELLEIWYYDYDNIEEVLESRLLN